jgi:hypothetical protein
MTLRLLARLQARAGSTCPLKREAAGGRALERRCFEDGVGDIEMIESGLVVF